MMTMKLKVMLVAKKIDDNGEQLDWGLRTGRGCRSVAINLGVVGSCVIANVMKKTTRAQCPA